jgi:hypothetical protein
MNRLVEIRVAEALENIKRIEAAMEKASNRRIAADGLANDLAYLLLPSNWKNHLQNLVDSCQSVVDFGLPGKSISRQSVLEAKQAMDVLHKQFMKLQSGTKQLQTYRFDLKNKFDRHIGRAGKVLNGRREKLEKIRENQISDGLGAVQALIDLEENKPFWAEHIESVAGMVLRDEGFDGGLSQYAEEIIRFFEVNMKPPTETLNVLGRDQTERHDLSQMVYFRFPTWSVWGLPLTAHDFWQTWSCEKKEIEEELLQGIPNSKEIWARPLVQDCLADTFATYAIGPAYAFACVVLRLKAHSAEDQLRAEGIFKTLDYISEDTDTDWMSDGQDRSWREGLEQAWTGACGGPTAPLPCLLGEQCKVAGPLLNAYWASSDLAQGPAKGRQQLAKALAGIGCPSAHAGSQCALKGSALMADMRTRLLRQLPRKMRYSRDAWSGVGEGLKGYLAGTRRGLPEKGSYDLRHILHGAWLVRWGRRKEEDAEVAQIAERALALAEIAVPTSDTQSIGTDRTGSA